MMVRLVALLVCALAAPALAAPTSWKPPPTKAPTSTYKPSWKERFLERRETHWRKPAGDLFPKPATKPPPPPTIMPPTEQPGAKQPPVADPDQRRRVRALVKEQSPPFAATGGFGKRVRRATSHERIAWEKRAGKLKVAAAGEPKLDRPRAHVGKRGFRKVAPKHQPPRPTFRRAR
jgi:hypothetical protein